MIRSAIRREGRLRRSDRCAWLSLVPFVFTTGYDAGVIPPRFSQIARCEKSVDISKVAQAIGTAIHG